MARIRSIHPGMFTDEGYMALSLAAKACWPGIWTEADDAGVFDWKPLTLKAKLLPAENVSMAALLDEMLEHGLIRQFEIDGKIYGAIKNFGNWQRPKKPTDRYPLPAELRTYVALKREHSVQVPHQSSTPSESSQQREEEGGRKKKVDKSSTSSTDSAASASPKRGTRLSEDWQLTPELRAFASDMGLDPDGTRDEFVDYWTAVPGSKGVKLDWDKTFKNRCRELAKRPTRSTGGNGSRYVTVPPTPAGPTADDWRGRVKWHREKGMWNPNWGPEPGKPGCFVPREFLQ